MGQVVLGATDTLAATIERAKLVETGVNFTLQAVSNTPITTTVKEPVKKTQLLHLNLLK